MPSYDFSEALSLPIMGRFESSVAILQKHAQAEAVIYSEVLIPLQPGYSEDEIAELERSQGTPFDSEVRKFLRHWKRVQGYNGFSFYGSESWVTDEKFMGRKFAGDFYLVIGDYWRYADGDLLVMPLLEASDKVFLYLHEDGPKIEEFAPTFSLALWRIAHENFQE